MVAPAALEELVEEEEAPDGAADAVGVVAAEAEEVVAAFAVILGGVRCPQLAASFLAQRAWAAASPTPAALHSLNTSSQMKVGIVCV